VLILAALFTALTGLGFGLLQVSPRSATATAQGRSKAAVRRVP
jgi:hypothetical protein